MRRRFGLLLLLFSVLWQSVVAAGGRWAPDGLEDAMHAALHWQGDAHHHHEDGSFHVDDSDEALAHVQLDGALQLTALLGADTFAVRDAEPVTPAAPRQQILPTPPPEKLRRPPRTRP